MDWVYFQFYFQAQERKWERESKIGSLSSLLTKACTNESASAKRLDSNWLNSSRSDPTRLVASIFEDIYYLATLATTTCELFVCRALTSQFRRVDYKEGEESERLNSQAAPLCCRSRLSSNIWASNSNSARQQVFSRVESPQQALEKLTFPR